MSDHLPVPERPHSAEQAYLAAILHELKEVRALVARLQPVEPPGGPASRPAPEPALDAKPRRGRKRKV